VFEERLNTFYTKDKDIDSFTDARATHEVPKEAIEQWQKISNILTAVSALRRWENLNHIKSQPVTRFQSISLQTFIEAWLSGDALLGGKYGPQENFKHPDGLIIV